MRRSTEVTSKNQLCGLNKWKQVRANVTQGAQCGATCVDEYFLKEFLRERLGEREYLRLVRWGDRRTNASGVSLDVLGRGLQIVLDNFRLLKQDFAGPQPSSPHDATPDTIELPKPIGEGEDHRGYFKDSQLFITG